MQVDQHLAEQLRIHDEFHFVLPPEAEPQPCSYAQAFESWAQVECKEALTAPTHVKINVAMLQVFKSYMERRAAIPKTHRYQVGNRGHRCVWHVLESMYEQLRTVELQLGPPKLFEPPPPQPLPPPPLVPDMFMPNAQ